MLYCPTCLNTSLKMNNHGVVNLTINGIQMDSGRFLYNLGTQTKKEIANELKAKLEIFFKWYASFKNREPINKLDISSSDFYCEDGCSLGIGKRFNVIGILVSEDSIKQILNELGDKYNISIDHKSLFGS